MKTMQVMFVGHLCTFCLTVLVLVETVEIIENDSVFSEIDLHDPLSYPRLQKMTDFAISKFSIQENIDTVLLLNVLDAYISRTNGNIYRLNLSMKLCRAVYMCSIATCMMNVYENIENGEMQLKSYECVVWRFGHAKSDRTKNSSILNGIFVLF
jgi:hypothetical protein